MSSSAKLYGLCLAFLLLFAACDTSNNDNTMPDAVQENPMNGVGSASDDSSTELTDAPLADWLQQVKTGELESESADGQLAWRLGYLLHYGELEGIGLDNLIYNALEVHRRLDTGEIDQDSISRNEENLLALTEEIQYESETALVDQVAQSPEIRESILQHVTVSQQDLSPREALESNNLVGVFAPPATDTIGGKYLVFTQETPDADFSFLGVIMAVDSAGHERPETYSFQGWQALPWLGDATGPFWNDLPAGVSGDPANTREGRPGILLVSEETYETIAGGDF